MKNYGTILRQSRTVAACVLALFFVNSASANPSPKNQSPSAHGHTVEINGQAIEITRNVETMGKQIREVHNYADELFKKRNFDAGYLVINALIPPAIEYNDSILVAQILESKAEAKYSQRRYDEAEALFFSVCDYANGDSKKEKKLRSNAFHHVGMIYKRKGDHRNASMYHYKAYELNMQVGNKKGMARTLKNVANAEQKLGNTLDALDYVIRALELHEEFEDRRGFAETLMLGGRIYRRLARYEKSLELVQKAHEMHKEMGNLGKLAFSSNQIGQLYSQLKKFDQARAFYQNVVDLPKDEIPVKYRADAYRELGIIGLNLGQYDEAISYVTIANSLYESIGNIEKQSITMRISGEVLFAKGQIEKSRSVLLVALVLAKQSKSAINQVKVLNRLGRTLIPLDITEAREAFQNALQTSRELGFREETIFSLEGLVTVERMSQNYSEALNLSTELIIEMQRVYDESDRDMLAFAKSQLDSYKTETELNLLKEKVRNDELLLQKKNTEIQISQHQNKIASLEITKNRYAITLLVFLLTVIFTIGIYFYRQFVKSRLKNAELDVLATRDPLTNCYNRRALFSKLDSEQYALRKEEPLTVVMVDIDHFKQVNDSFGHDKGDLVLCGVVDRLESCIRSSDVLARYGGEEFCIVLKNTSIERACSIAEQMRISISATQISDISITASFGVAFSSNQEESASQLISKADKALLNSKRSGRNQITVYSKEVEQRLRDTSHI